MTSPEKSCFRQECVTAERPLSLAQEDDIVLRITVHRPLPVGDDVFMVAREEHMTEGVPEVVGTSSWTTTSPVPGLILQGIQETCAVEARRVCCNQQVSGFSAYLQNRWWFAADDGKVEMVEADVCGNSKS